MATIWQEPGSDATGDLSFLSGTVGAVSSSTDQPRTGPRAIKCDSGAGATAYGLRSGVLADTGRRISICFYLEALPGSTVRLLECRSPSSTVNVLGIGITSAGVLQILTGPSTQLGSNGSTLSIGQYYRLTLAYTVTSTTIFEIRLYVDDSTSPDISVTSSGTLGDTGTGELTFGWRANPGAAKILHVDDVYIDNSASLTAFSGDIHVTAKLPASENTNNFDTAIGNARGSTDYNNVNERPYSETNGWQHAAATDVQENYGLQSASAGDADLTNATLISRTAWLIGKRSALTPCTFRAGAASGSTNPTTSLTITVPAGTATGDSLFVALTSRDHTVGTAYPTVVDDDTGGNTWTRIAESTDRKATLWWKRATAATASKTITVTGCVGSCSGGVSVHQNAATSVTPYTNLSTMTSNASGTESHATFTPDNAGSSICFAVFNYADDDTVSTQSTASLGAMSEDWEHTSTGGSDCGTSVAHINGTDSAPAATGSITWAQANSVTYTISWAVRPEDSAGAPDIIDNGTETAIALTTSSALYTLITDSANYPSNAAGIGMRSGGGSADTYLYECGTIIAYIPSDGFIYTPPTFISETETTWNNIPNTTPSVTTSSFAVQAGDILVAMGGVSDESISLALTHSGGAGITFTEQQQVNVSDYTRLYCWTATVDANKSMTCTFTRTGSSTTVMYGGSVLVFRGSDGVGASNKTNVASGAPSLNLTTTQAKSAIVTFSGDWSAQDGTSRTWRTVNDITPTAGNGLERTYFRDAEQYSVYIAYYSDVGAVGEKTVGLSDPGSQKYSIVAVEVKGTFSEASPGESVVVVVQQRRFRMMRGLGR